MKNNKTRFRKAEQGKGLDKLRTYYEKNESLDENNRFDIDHFTRLI